MSEQDEFEFLGIQELDDNIDELPEFNPDTFQGFEDSFENNDFDMGEYLDEDDPFVFDSPVIQEEEENLPFDSILDQDLEDSAEDYFEDNFIPQQEEEPIIDDKEEDEEPFDFDSIDVNKIADNLSETDKKMIDFIRKVHDYITILNEKEEKTNNKNEPTKELESKKIKKE